MDFSSIEVALRSLNRELNKVDVASLSGEEVSQLIDVLAPVGHSFDSVLLAACHHGVAVNQHSAEGAKSGASWVGSKIGVSVRQACLRLAAGSALDDLPDVASAFSSGLISMAAACAVALGAEGRVSSAEVLLNVAVGGGSVESINRKAAEIKASNTSDSERDRLRKKQFINVRQGRDSLVRGEICLLPEQATGILAAYKASLIASGYERAEMFVDKLSSLGKKATQVIFHLDLLSDRTELVGHGPVARQAALEVLEHASRSFVGTVGNKLAWFSEQDRRSTTAPLTEIVRRAILSRDWHSCGVEGCTDAGSDVDHVIARTNGGTNDFENLQSLCEPDHDVKTKVDAPWTVGGIYGKRKGEVLMDTG